MKHYVNHEMIDPELSLIFHFRMTYARNPTYYIDVCCQKLKLLWNICSYSICGVFFRDFLTVVKGKTLWIFRLKGNQLIPNSNCWSPTVVVVYVV